MKNNRSKLIGLIIAIIVALSGGTYVATDALTESGQDIYQANENITEQDEATRFYFRDNERKTDHYYKHGKEMGFASADEYEAAASDVVLNPDTLRKLEDEDGDYVFYLEETNDIVFLSKDGYIRTYFRPDSGKRYFDKQ